MCCLGRRVAIALPVTLGLGMSPGSGSQSYNLPLTELWLPGSRNTVVDREEIWVPAQQAA